MPNKTQKTARTVDKELSQGAYASILRDQKKVKI